MPSMRPLAFAIPLAVAAATLGVAAPSAQATPAGSSTCRGQGVDPAAQIRYGTDTVIKAPLSTIWKLQTDVERWPAWQAPVLTMKRLNPGPLRKGSKFVWTTPAQATPTTPETTLTITSTVRQLRHGDCILWKGPAIGDGLRIDEGVHLWKFTKVKGSVRVHTEETWTGDQVESNAPMATEALGAGLEQWLRDLKATAEADQTASR